MYTEYVFENKRYEVACREIKATLFDIVTAEEEKIASLRDKAFVDATDSKQAAELQNLYVQQDACLREILSISDQLTKSMQRVDTCSRKLKQIEDKNIAQIIATIHDVNEAQQMMAMQTQPQMMDVAQSEKASGPAVVDEGDSYAASQVSSAVDVAMAPEPVDEPVIHEVVEVPENAAQESATVDVPQEEQIIREVMDIPEETQQETTTDETPQEEQIIREVMDIPEEETQEVVSTEVPQTEQVVQEVVSAPAEVTPTVDAVMDPIVETSIEPVVATTADVSAEPAITPVNEVGTEAPSAAPLITPTPDVPVEASTSGPLIPIENTSSVETSSSLIPTDTADASATTQVITVSSDGPLEATSGTPLIPPENSSVEVAGGTPEMGIPEIVPNAEVQSSDVLTPVAASTAENDMLVFKKRTADPPKVIMISGRQAGNLRKSLPTQEALLSAKGYFKSETPAEGNLEQQLVNNGLLEPDTAAKQAQIEQMMNQANALYAAGKIEEAQAMYNQISELNQALQGESVGITK